MEHHMKLNPTAFAGVQEGKQKIEVRLHDDKRRQIAVGDQIAFSMTSDPQQQLTVEVLELLIHASFAELFEHMDLADWNAAGWSVDQAVECCRGYYSQEDEVRFGVVGIRVGLV